MVGVRFRNILALSFIALTSTAKAEVLFEGYARVYSLKKPIGYAISKYEFDAKKKNFVAITFLKVQTDAGEMTESLKAFADEKMNPVSYSYTQLLGKETKIIDAKFSGNKMTGMINTNGKKQNIKNTLPKNTILSTFLYYYMTLTDGLKVKLDKHFSAIAEEEGQVVEKGFASVVSEEDYSGVKVFKIKNDFKGKYTSYVTGRGEIIATKSDDNPISTELMADAKKATEGFQVNSTVLKALFGEVPEGKKNILAQTTTTTTEPAGKQQGIPQGQGIQIKAEPSNKTEPATK